MGVNIRDVAAHANVSVATVSRALRGHMTVSDSTRLRVETSAEALGYILPNRSESRHRTMRVAVVMPHLGRWYFSKVLEGIESVVADRDGDVMVFRPFDKQNHRRSLDDVLDSSLVDAAIVVSLAVTEEEIDGLRSRGISVSLLGTHMDSVPSVRIDDVDAARQVTQHMIDLGHTRIGLVSSAAFDPTPGMVAAARRAGYQQAMTEAGLEVDPAMQVETDFSIRGAQRAVERLFSSEQPPTAIVAESDELAFGVIAAARSHGLNVPEDLSVAGIDGHEVADVWGLTTVAQPVTSLGEVAAWQAISPGQSPAAITMPTSLIVRQSTAAPLSPSTLT
jgi:DNA-binding LacI/PurR family transcriptional regulator